MTWFRVPLACLVFALVLAPFSASGAAPGPCPGVTDNEEWTTIDAPPFPATEPAQITAYAVQPYLPDALYVTNGKTVMASMNGGCSWTTAFTLDLLGGLGVQVVGPAATVRSIVMPESAPTDGGFPIYLLIEEGVGGAAVRPHVVVSQDGGKSWAAGSTGLGPITGSTLKLRAAPSEPDTLYLLNIAAGTGTSEMYATTNAGTLWEKRGEQLGVSDFAIDPFYPDELWMVGAIGLRHSTDGARTSVDIPYLAPSVTYVDVFRASPDSPSRILARETETNSINRSDDGGKTWTRSFGPPQDSFAIAHGNTSDDVVLSSHLAFHRFQSPHYWIDVAEPMADGEEYQDIHDLQVDRTKMPAVFGFTPTAIKRYNGFSMSLPPLISGKVPVKADATLTASERVVRLEPGESRKVDYKLSIPPAPTPLDVYFILDTSVSMRSSIEGLTAGIHDISQELALAKVDARFGLAEFKDYPIPGFGEPTEFDVPYRQVRDLGAADEELVAALESLRASGGGDIPESQLTALYQSVTGQGEPGFVEPGQEADFRGDALKVLIHITDAPFNNSPAHPSPSFAQVAGELKNKGILQIGLATWGRNNTPEAAEEWLSNMATETGTLAPEQGVDCEDDGEIDIAPGEPLVCVIADETEEGVAALAPPILATLRALTDKADVSLVPLSGESFIEIAPATYPGVNVKVPNVLNFDGLITCPETGSQSGPIELVATVADETVAGTTTKFICGPAEEKKAVPPEKEDQPPAPIVPPVPVPQPALAPVPPPPAPPAPVTQAQPQPNPHVQGALAQQEQDQVQVAMAHSFDQASEEYAFSSYSRRSRGPGSATTLYMSALVMTAAGTAFALRRRTQSSLARSRR